MNTKVLSAALVASLMNFVTFLAHAASTPSFVFLPWSSTTELAQSALNSTLEISREVTNYTVNAAGIPIVIPNIQFTAKVPVQAQQVDNVTNLSGSPASVDVSVPTFSINTTINKVIGSIHLNLHIKAQCSGLHLTLNSGALVSTILWERSGNFVDLLLSPVLLSWQPSQWAVSSFICQGLEGLDPVVQNFLKAELSDPNLFAPMVQKFLQLEINQKVSALKSALANVVQLEILNSPLFYRLQGVADLNSQGLVLALEIAADPAELANSSAVLNADSLAGVDFSKFRAPAWILQTQDLEGLLKQIFTKGNFSLSMNAIPSFEKLLGSWFAKLFLWPDLLNFHKSDQFQLLSRVSDQNMNLQIAKNLRIQVQATIGSWVMAPRAGKIWPYLYIDSRFNSGGSFSIDRSRLQVSFANPKLSDQFTFGPDYLKAFHPSQRLAKSVVEDSLLQLLQNQNFTFSLPQLNLSAVAGGKVVEIQTAQEINNFIFFNFGSR